MKRFFLVFLVFTASILFAGDSGEDFRFVYFTDVHLEQGKNAVQGFESAVKKINELNPDFVISGGAVCGAWWDGSNKGVEEGFLLLEIKGNGDEFGWEYIDYGWEVKK